MALLATSTRRLSHRRALQPLTCHQHMASFRSPLPVAAVVDTDAARVRVWHARTCHCLPCSEAEQESPTAPREV
jgi:hypothetical protein